MQISIDRALKTLKTRGWPIRSTEEGRWIIEQAILTTEELGLLAALLLRDQDRPPKAP
jgi:hypothetical protein